MYSFEVKKFGVVIFESLYEEDAKTGTELKDGLLKYKTFQIEEMEIELYTISTKSELIEILQNIIERIKNEFFFPILHFEIHGYEDGICTNSGECISWREIIPFFREINILLKNLLLVVLGVCKGVSIIKYIGTDTRAPFKAIIGSAGEIKSWEIQQGFHAFYDTFFFSMDVFKSIKALREVVNSDSIGISVIEDLYDKITNPHRDPKLFNRIVHDRMQEMMQKNPQLRNKNFSELEKQAIKEIEAIFEIAKNKKGYFLMEDLINPELAAKEHELYSK